MSAPRRSLTRASRVVQVFGRSISHRHWHAGFGFVGSLLSCSSPLNYSLPTLRLCLPIPSNNRRITASLGYRLLKRRLRWNADHIHLWWLLLWRTCSFMVVGMTWNRRAVNYCSHEEEILWQQPILTSTSCLSLSVSWACMTNQGFLLALVVKRWQ